MQVSSRRSRVGGGRGRARPQSTAVFSHLQVCLVNERRRGERDRSGLVLRSHLLYPVRILCQMSLM